MKNPLHSLPRDDRDTLLTLAVALWVLLPQWNHLPLWCSALSGLLLAWRAWLTLTHGTPSHAPGLHTGAAASLPRSRWLLLIGVLACVAVVREYGTLLGRDPGVALLAVLLALKTLEMRAQRDAMVVFFLGFFMLLAQFFFSQSLLTAIHMLLGLLALLTLLVLAHMPSAMAQEASLRSALGVACKLAAWGTPLMLVLFVLFPRVAPLWRMPQDLVAGKSGLSNHMEVGRMAQLALDDSVAMFVRFDDPVPRPDQLYFRGPVLSVFDGQRWTSAASAADSANLVGPLDAALLLPQGPAVRYQIILNAPLADGGQTVLPVLDATTTVDMPNQHPHGNAELSWFIPTALQDSVRYRASSHVEFGHGAGLSNTSRLRNLQLPMGYNPRTQAWATDLRRQAQQRYPQAADSAQRTQWLVQTVLEHIRTGGYTYTLEPGTYGRDSADEFWFDRKLGFCEHFAAGFVIAMRGAGVPARVVTGYQGAQVNALDGAWVVRQSDAHAWAEVWRSDVGWQRVDPTAAIAPGRIGSYNRLQTATGAVVSQVVGTISPNLLVQWRALWDAVNNQWTQWVLNYGQNRQMRLLERLGFESPDWQQLGQVLGALLAAVAGVGIAWAWWDKRQHNPWLRLLHRAAQRLGYPTPHESVTPGQLQAWVGNSPLPVPAQEAWQAWLAQLQAWRYAAQERASLKTLRQKLRGLERPRVK
ncbi:DUF3488 domain-containing transglutaminase family protein [Curvibacter sp. CHRR-16]|uniref:transglutaminase family protein n=1 Tax=Curvibacter sp. CHRR-16 TaxID=2835872 RepID=UPI001BDA02C9|nr:DUF3488 and transglutaminase-like domain-containing protein [Curvibacter sp. CHRR-16]MBT0568903.1 DUF3488 domain-containing transglutaminase family protein [Curvibacter sp. CHRR-16]